MTPKTHVSAKAQQFTESVIREMTRLCQRYQGVNLAQGFPDFPAPMAVKTAAADAILRDVNQYAVTWGAEGLRKAIAEKYRRCAAISIDPEREITVCCGSTEAMLSALLATVDPGDEVIVFEPFYENYGPDAVLSGAQPVHVRLHQPDWHFDPAELRRAFGPNTKGIIVNTPHNPTGKVFTLEELRLIGDLAVEFDALIYTDEIYEHIVYDGRKHAYPIAMPGLRERTVMISGLSKTFSVTGWRIGYAIAPPHLTQAIRKVHDYCTVGAPSPLQEGGVTALDLGDAYLCALAADYQKRRDLFLPLLVEAGFSCRVPEGAYYVMARYPDIGYSDDVSFARFLVEQAKVATVPASSFYRPGESEAKSMVRFCFPKKEETLLEAGRRLFRALGRGSRR